MMKELEVFWDCPSGRGGGHKCPDESEMGGAEPEREGRKDAMLPALATEEGATGQGGQTSVETGRGEETDVPSESLKEPVLQVALDFSRM